MANILVKLGLTTDDYEKGLRKAQRGTQDFDKMIGTAAKSVTAFMGVIGVAVTVGEGFNKMVNSSQTLSDEYNRTLDGLRGTVDNLFYSFANGDWTPFLEGLNNSIELAREAYTALDQLGNTTMSYGYFSSKNQAGLQEQITILRDKTASKEQKAIAKAEADRILAEQKEITEQLSRRSEEALVSLIKKSTGLSDLDVSQVDLEKALRLDVTYLGDEEKKILSAQYKEFQKQSESLKKNYTTQRISTEGDITSTYNTTDTEGLRNALKPLLANYQDAIVYNSTLVKESDEWLQNLINIAQASFSAEQAYASMLKTANRSTQAGIKTGDSKKEKIVYEEGSIGYLKKEISDLQKEYEKAADEGTRSGLNKAIQEAQYNLNRMVFMATQKIINTPGLNKEVGARKTSFGRNPADDIEAGKLKIKPIKTEAIKANYDYADSLSAIASIMGSVTNITNQGAAAWFSWGANTIAAVAAAIPAITALTVAKKAEASANAQATVTGSMSSVASIPVVGWLMALSAGAAVIASISSIPKFETGGMVKGPGPLRGDNILARLNPGEVVLNRAQQRNLAEQLTSSPGARLDVNVTGRVSGRDLEIVLDKRKRYNTRTR